MRLKLSIGQHSDRGRKESNQDFHGALIPDRAGARPEGHCRGAGRRHRSQQGQPDRQPSRRSSGFLTDYYCTSEFLVGEDLGAAGHRRDQFLARRPDAAQRDRRRARPRQGLCLHAERDGGQGAHRALFHVGDSRVYRVAGQSLEQLTDDHRVVVSSEQSYLGRALGINPQVEIDYRRRSSWRPATCFVLATDGVYEHVEPRASSRRPLHDGRGRSRRGREKRSSRTAFERGSPDNLTVQIVRVDALPDGEAAEAGRRRPSCRCRRCSSPRSSSTATGSCASSMTAAAATSISRSIPKPRPARRSCSRSRRSTCAAIRPISAAS